jgi:actin-like ATPase involved in cell morphogenesis
VSVPANSSSAQRFLTLDAFRRAGFTVTSLLNEPSAAGFEYAHRYRETITAKREYVVVYDLGGGTFDASLLRMTGRANDVVTSEGVRRLGGDDFDETIANLVASKAKLGTLTSAQRQLLVEECARQKESISPQTRRFLVDLSAFEKDPLAIPIDEIYDACEPLVSATIDALTPVLRDARREGESEVDWNEVAGIYIVGGAGAFPLVLRRLRERFGEKRVRRSSQPFAATAIGLAITLDQEAGYTLEERLTRTFGVFREASGGGDVTFDPIFLKDTPLPRGLTAPRRGTHVPRGAQHRTSGSSVRASRGGRPDSDLAVGRRARGSIPRSARSRACRASASSGARRARGGGALRDHRQRRGGARHAARGRLRREPTAARSAGLSFPTHDDERAVVLRLVGARVRAPRREEGSLVAAVKCRRTTRGPTRSGRSRRACRPCRSPRRCRRRGRPQKIALRDGGRKR